MPPDDGGATAVAQAEPRIDEGVVELEQDDEDQLYVNDGSATPVAKEPARVRQVKGFVGLNGDAVGSTPSRTSSRIDVLADVR